MAKTNTKFENENAFLLAKFEEIAVLVEHQKVLKASLNQQLLGLKYEKEELKKEIEALKKKNSILKAEIGDLKNKLEKERTLLPQNFKIKNKIIKIVSDIDEKETGSGNLKELVESLIDEIDHCIHLLEK
ncbi:hypothetical protein GVN16_20965 [Emticicia sp. CRIBPO]|jgi:predicted  nucleic acid-binding Zn-ribbon protein|uniref:hypothetical protein n=1 Tax=Emticicia sp. CRIBPO TaxID=2683258 RepID=UPI0014133135|nr:hypothetical protein [Emticicia sp. CRIBPO]NBA88257.1 hypothetical protein [Emticicia sp. CRIBPO]